MISVIVPARDAEAHLAETLTSLIAAAVDGLVREVIVADGGSTDRTLEIADSAGAEIVKTGPGRGAQLKAGAERARFPWLLFLDAETALAPGWEREAGHHMERVESGRRRAPAAVFRLAIDDEGFGARTRERFASLRTHVLKLPHGAQGLLIPRRVYDEVGGFHALPFMEDVDLVRRIGRNRLAVLDARAVRGGGSESSLAEAARGQICLGLFLLGVPVRTVATLLGPAREPAGEPAVQRGAP